MSSDRLQLYWEKKIFVGVDAIYTFIIEFVSIINCISFPCKSKCFSSFNINFYVVGSNTPTANEIYGSL